MKKEKDNKCIINIFCFDAKHECDDGHEKHDGNCVINIFCNDKNKHEKHEAEYQDEEPKDNEW